MYGAVTLRSPDGGLEATFLTELGMVGSSLRHHGDELLAQRDGPEGYAQRKATFGIPLLHPWANRLGSWEYTAGGRQVVLDPASPVLKRDAATGLPIHGALAANPNWRVEESSSSRLRASFDFGAHPELLGVFPFRHRLSFEAGVSDDTLTLELKVKPTGDEPVPIAFGFHPYLALGSDRRGWRLRLPIERRALLDDRGIPTGEHQTVSPGAWSGVLGDRGFDDSFDRLAGPDPVALSVSDGLRQVSVEYRTGYPVAQVYAPAGSPFIAFEPMTAPVDALRSGDGLRFVGPGETFSAEFAIAVTRPA